MEKGDGSFVSFISLGLGFVVSFLILAITLRDCLFDFLLHWSLF